MMVGKPEEKTDSSGKLDAGTKIPTRMEQKMQS